MKRSQRKCGGKVWYRDRISAEIVRANVARLPSADTPCRSYPCPRCGGWHLTSKPKRKWRISL